MAGFSTVSRAINFCSDTQPVDWLRETRDTRDTKTRQDDVNVKTLSSVRKLYAGDATIKYKNPITEVHMAIAEGCFVPASSLRLTGKSRERTFG
jgi:hypothetical protein